MRSLQIYFDIHTHIFTWFMYLIWNTFMPNLEIVRLWLRLWDCEQEQEQFSGKWMASKRFREECSHCKKKFKASEMQQEKAASTLNLCLKMRFAVAHNVSSTAFHCSKMARCTLHTMSLQFNWFSQHHCSIVATTQRCKVLYRRTQCQFNHFLTQSNRFS